MVDRPQLQAPRGVQASGTNRTSPCTHPSEEEGRGLERMDPSLRSPCGPQGACDDRHAGESALHERDHRGGDHPIPFRTRQLSPPSPKVLQRQAAGGQGVALMQGASVFQWGLRALFLFLGTFCGMSSCGSRQALARFGRLNSRKKFPSLLIYALCYMLRIASCELLFHGEVDSPFALCVFFLARALFSFRYY